MKTESGKDMYKFWMVKPGSKLAEKLANDPVLVKQREENRKYFREHPIPEWLLKIARGEA